MPHGERILDPNCHVCIARVFADGVPYVLEHMHARTDIAKQRFKRSLFSCRTADPFHTDATMWGQRVTDTTPALRCPCAVYELPSALVARRTCQRAVAHSAKTGVVGLLHVRESI